MRYRISDVTTEVTDALALLAGLDEDDPGSRVLAAANEATATVQTRTGAAVVVFASADETLSGALTQPLESDDGRWPGYVDRPGAYQLVGNLADGTPFAQPFDIVDAATLPTIQLEYDGDFPGFVSPQIETFWAAVFTPIGESVVVDVTVGASVVEASGGHSNVVMFYGDPSLSPLNWRKQDDGIKPGVTVKTLGGLGALRGSLHGRVKLDGLTPGEPVAVELALSVTGYMETVPLGDKPTRWACSSISGAVDFGRVWRFGTYAVAGVNLRKLHLLASQHYEELREEVLGSIELSTTDKQHRVDITGNGAKAVTTTYEDNGPVRVVDVRDQLVEFTTSAGAGSAPIGVAISPSHVTAWVLLANAAGSRLRPLSLIDGTWLTAGLLLDAVVPSGIALNADGSKAWVTLDNAKLLEVDLDESPSVTHTLARTMTGLIGARTPVLHPDGETLYLLTGTKDVRVVDLDGWTSSGGRTLPAEVTVANSLSIFADGLALLVACDAAAYTIQHLVLPELHTYTRWYAPPSGSTNQTEIALSPTGSIYGSWDQLAHDLKGLAVWQGVKVSSVAASTDFTGERASMTFQGVSEAHAT